MISTWWIPEGFLEEDMLKVGGTGEKGKDFQAERIEHANTGKGGAAWLSVAEARQHAEGFQGMRLGDVKRDAFGL